MDQLSQVEERAAELARDLTGDAGGAAVTEREAKAMFAAFDRQEREEEGEEEEEDVFGEPEDAHRPPRPTAPPATAAVMMAAPAKRATPVVLDLELVPL
jgi:hypothetical protein